MRRLNYCVKFFKITEHFNKYERVKSGKHNQKEYAGNGIVTAEIEHGAGKQHIYAQCSGAKEHYIFTQLPRLVGNQ